MNQDLGKLPADKAKLNARLLMIYAKSSTTSSPAHLGKWSATQTQHEMLTRSSRTAPIEIAGGEMGIEKASLSTPSQSTLNMSQSLQRHVSGGDAHRGSLSA